MWVTTQCAWDDLYVNDEAVRLGPQRISTYYPSADTATSDFTPSTGATNFGTIDETTANVTDYNEGGTQGLADLFDFPDFPYSPPNIRAIQLHTTAAKTDVNTKKLELLVDDGTLSAGPAQTLTTSPLFQTPYVLPVTPTGSNPWTKAALDSLKIGYRINE